jgi:aerobic carbon-monoxide dehydrogenase large subunit
MNTTTPFAIGESTTRVEDQRFLTGRGRYIGDVNLPNQAYVHFVRSPHAHAEIRGIDKAAAAAKPGVLAVFTIDDLGNDLGTTTVTFKRSRPDGSPMFWRAHPGLARGFARHVGEPVAMVIAETIAQAKDAADVLEIDYEGLPSVTDTAGALDPQAPRVWAECPDNVSHIFGIGDQVATAAAFAKAKHVVKRRYVVTRVHSQYMEPRAAIGAYDSLDEKFTLHADLQTLYRARELLAKDVFKIPENRIRVVAYDVGGAFGGKGPQAVEHRLLLWAAKRLGRPVKWQGDRSETLLSDEHARDNIHEVELALDADGKFLGLRSHWIANVGAYVNSDRNFQATFQNTPGMVGVYDFPAAHVRFTCVMSNTGSLAPYRGAGRPEATYATERLIDDAARELGFDPVELRRKNLIRPEQMPRKTPLGYLYDCGEFEKCMDMALDLADWKGFDARRKFSATKGLLRGIGIANPIERAAAPGFEYAELRFESNGKATVLMGSKNQGQGHETTFMQVLGSKLGLAPQDIHYVDGDTDRVAFGVGTFGSRTAATGGSALAIAAGKVVDKGKLIAAHLLEAAPADISFAKGRFVVEGTDRGVSLKEVAAAAFTPGKLPMSIEPGLFESGIFAPEDNTYPYGTHVCEVEIDPETGAVRIVRYVVSDDVGTVINPLLVKGQIHGGVGQGAGQVLLERIVYDKESGQLMTATFMDYAMPRADDFCEIEIKSLSVPTQRNPLGVKGAGEAGAVGALPALMNAIVDALAPLGVKEFEMPATPDRVWRAIRLAKH